MRTGSRMNFLVTSNTSAGIVAESRTTWRSSTTCYTTPPKKKNQHKICYKRIKRQCQLWHLTLRLQPKNIKKEVRPHLIFSQVHNNLLPRKKSAIIIAWNRKSGSHNYSRPLLMQKGILFVLWCALVSYLNVCAQFLEDLIDLILEAATQHLIGFIQNKHLDPFWSCREMSCLLANISPIRASSKQDL